MNSPGFATVFPKPWAKSKGCGQGLSEGEQHQVEALDEEGQTDQHQHHADYQLRHVGQRPPEHNELEEQDDQQDGRQVLCAPAQLPG